MKCFNSKHTMDFDALFICPKIKRILKSTDLQSNSYKFAKIRMYKEYSPGLIKIHSDIASHLRINEICSLSDFNGQIQFHLTTLTVALTYPGTKINILNTTLTYKLKE